MALDVVSEPLHREGHENQRPPAARQTRCLEPLERHHAEGLAAALRLTDPLSMESRPARRDEVSNTSTPHWHGETRAPPYRSRSCGWTITPSLIDTLLEHERWSWPPGHASHGRSVRTSVKLATRGWRARQCGPRRTPKPKMLMLTHAFEVWHVLCVCFYTDSRNARSRAALERIGGQFEGILRATVWPLIHPS